MAVVYPDPRHLIRLVNATRGKPGHGVEGGGLLHHLDPHNAKNGFGIADAIPCERDQMAAPNRR